MKDYAAAERRNVDIGAILNGSADAALLAEGAARIAELERQVAELTAELALAYAHDCRQAVAA